MVSVALGLRAFRGGSVVVAVAVDRRAPRVVLSTFLATADEGDRLSLEPYHVAAELVRGSRGRGLAQAAAAVAEGRKRQDELAANGLADIRRELERAQCKPVVAALLVNRAGWVDDLLRYSLFAPGHPPVAEGLAVRDALRFALDKCGVEVVEMDEKSLHEVASSKLHLSPVDIDVQLNGLGKTAGRPWRKEQKLACLSAWIALRRL
jgi:hypothetical protein